MQYTDDRSHLHVEIHEKDCQIAQDELERMQRFLDDVGQSVQSFPRSDLWIKITHHPRSDAYHVEAKLKLPGKTLFSGDQDSYLDSAFQRCIHKLIHRVEMYRENPDSEATEQARKLEALDDNIVAPEPPEGGMLGAAIAAGDYARFRLALSLYEEWLRKRVGRWIQRYPEAETQLHKGRLRIGDVIEEVYLNAFEHFNERAPDQAVHDWLDGLIDPSLKLLLKHPDEESENASLARTVREMSL